MVENQRVTRQIELPLQDEDIGRLRAGDEVLLSGVLYSARDQAHKRLVTLIQSGSPLPIPLRGQVLYYVGPAPARPGQVIGPAGPTTASRMDPYTLPLLREGLRGMIGKGYRSNEVRRGLVKYGAVYFVAVGGAAAFIAQRIVEAELVAFEDLGPEAIYRLNVRELPVVVGNDAHGGDLFELGKTNHRTEEEENEKD